MAKLDNESWVGYSSRIIGVPKNKRKNKEKPVDPEDFSAFKKSSIPAQDVHLIEGIVKEMSSLGVVTTSHEDETWAAKNAANIFEKSEKSQASLDQAEKEALSEIAFINTEFIPPVDDGSLGWGDLLMDDCEDEEELLRELHERKLQGWE